MENSGTYLQLGDEGGCVRAVAGHLTSQFCLISTEAVHCGLQSTQCSRDACQHLHLLLNGLHLNGAESGSGFSGYCAGTIIQLPTEATVRRSTGRST